MKTIGFVGSSGSGKSYRAMDVAKKNGAKYIIDDGLLISENRIVAGVSAKKDATKIASVKSALFMNEAKANAMIEAIKSENPETILILGTSDKMVYAICERLSLPKPVKIIRIEDVSTDEEIKIAHKTRTVQGKHVIPVPTFEIKKDFSGYWMRAVRKLKNQPDYNSWEKSVVRPTFSYLGDYNIENKVITSISKYEAECVPCVYKVLQCTLQSEPQGLVINIDISVYYGQDMRKCARDVMRRVKLAIEQYTSINVISVNVFIKEMKR